jgi:hydrogenase maturation factor HypF (carbamoyltransferase family)
MNWKELGFEVINIDPGNVVLCDFCNKDFTNDDKSTGGILFTGHACCPDCLPEFMKGVRKYNEEKFIQATANENETFKDFVYRIRKGNY